MVLTKVRWWEMPPVNAERNQFELFELESKSRYSLQSVVFGGLLVCLNGYASRRKIVWCVNVKGVQRELPTENLLSWSSLHHWILSKLEAFFLHNKH